MKKKKRTPPKEPMGRCTIEQQDRGLYVVEKSDNSKHQRHVTVCSIDFYYHRDLISQYQHEAAGRLFMHATLANLTPGVRSANMAPTVRDGTNQTESTVASQMDAARKVRECLKSISGTRQRKAVEYVVIEGRYVSHLKRDTTYKKIEFEHFLEGIEYVAKFFGLI